MGVWGWKSDYLRAPAVSSPQSPAPLPGHSPWLNRGVSVGEYVAEVHKGEEVVAKQARSRAAWGLTL